jgi:undecaprenyl-diphosphatase
VLFQLALVVITLAFGALTFLVKITPVFATDVQITRTLQSIDHPFFAGLMYMISWLGFGPQVLIIAALIVICIYAFGLHWEAVAALAAIFASTGMNVLIKNIIERPRPTTDLVNVWNTLNSYSFPSGHVMFYTGFFGFLWFLAFSVLKPSFTRGLLLVVFGGLVLLIGPSRIYLGQHWASDVLGAYLLGSLTLIGIIQFYRWGKSRFFVHQPVAATEPQSV